MNTTPLSQPKTTDTIEKLISTVDQTWPTAKYLPSDRKTVSVFDYFNRMVRENPTEATETRRKEFRTELREETRKLLGETVAQSVYTQLKTNHSIATAQHFVPISSPNTLNPTLQTALGYIGRSEPDRANVIVLACAGISFANHYNPRSYTFHTETEELQLPLFGRAIDPYPVISKGPYTSDSLQQIDKRLRHFQSEKKVKKTIHEKLQEILKIISSEEILSQKSFVDQITIQNFHMWKQLFPESQSSVPNLVFLAQEKVAATLLKNYHLKSNTILNRMLFNHTYHELMLRYFDNITCAFSLERKYGTFLFWGMKKDTTQRIQLFPKNGKLVSFDETFSIEITPEAIGDALENGDLVPGVLLTFLVISLYYGMFINGGLLQPWYLSEAKQAYIEFLTELGETEEITYCQNIITNDIVITRPTLAFLETPQGSRITASGLDLLLYGEPTSWQTVAQATKHISYQELLLRTYPDIYKNYSQQNPKAEALLQVSEKDIDTYTNFAEKMPAWGKIEA